MVDRVWRVFDFFVILLLGGMSCFVFRCRNKGEVCWTFNVSGCSLGEILCSFCFMSNASLNGGMCEW